MEPDSATIFILDVRSRYVRGTDIVAGHAIANSELKNVILVDGESLYVRYVNALSPTAEDLFIIAD